jgi:hypothetical protein
MGKNKKKRQPLLLSSLLLALPSGLLGARQEAQDTRLATSSPKIRVPDVAWARPQTAPKTSRDNTPKRVSWADEYSSGSSGSLMQLSPARRVADSEKTVGTPLRLQGYVAVEQTARTHVERASMASSARDLGQWTGVSHNAKIMF